MNTLLIIITFINLSAFAVIAAVMVRRWRVGDANKWFFFMLLFGGLWVLDSFVQAILPQINNILTHSNFAIAALTAGSVTAFALHYPKSNTSLTTNRLLLILLPIVITTGLSFTDLFIKPITFKTVEPRPLFFLYFVIISVYFLVVPAISLFIKWKKAIGIPKLQIQTFLVGYLIAICIQLGESAYINIIGPLSVTADRIIINLTLPFIVFSAYSIARYRFLDVRIVMQRSLVRLTSFLVLLLIYLLLILFLRDSLISQTKEFNPVSLIVVGLLIILTVEPLRKYIYNFVDKRFELHDQQQERIQRQVQIVLKSQQTLSDLEQVIKKVLQESAKVDTVVYLEANDNKLIGKPALRAYLQSTGKVVITEELSYRLDEDPRYKQVNDEVKSDTVTAYVPIGQNEIFAGCFALGQRKGKAAYSAQEISAMKVMQSQATEAFLNARLYKQAVERIGV